MESGGHQRILTDAGEPSSAIGPGADLRGADLRGANLARETLLEADLSGADLTGADLSNADLRGASLHNATLDGARLLHADLRGADLSGVTARAALFGGASLDGASLFGADLAGATFSQATLCEVDGRTAVFSGCRFIAADLSRADLSRADASDTDLTDAVLDRASLHDTDLDGSVLRGIRKPATADWIGARFTNADFTGAYLARREAIDQNYLHEFKTQSRAHGILYFVWWVTSNCGRSFARWGTFTMLYAVIFASIYQMVDIDWGPSQSGVSPFYFSFVTLTTLGYGDVLPLSEGAQAAVIAQVVIGYVMLGGLLAIFANKMGRRGD